VGRLIPCNSYHATSVAERGWGDMSNIATKQLVQTWRYYTYDVWGNAEDGYDVNNVFRTADTVDIPVDCVTDRQLFEHLREVGFLNGKNLQADLFETDNNVSCEHTIYLTYDGKPEGELRLESECPHA
jgi:hypothetical protein